MSPTCWTDGFRPDRCVVIVLRRGFSTTTARAPAARSASTFSSTSSSESLGEIVSTARSGAPSQNPFGRPLAGIRSARMNATSAPTTVSGLRDRTKPVSAAKTFPNLLASTWYAKIIPSVAALQDRHERFLRDVDAADPRHALLAFLLPLEQLARAGDVAT